MMAAVRWLYGCRSGTPISALPTVYIYPVSQFVAWTYSITDTLIGPFAGAFPALTIGGFVVDVSTIFAMIGYVVIGWLIMQVLAFVFSIP